MEWTLNSNPVIVTPKVFQNDNQKFQIILEKALMPAPHPKRYIKFVKKERHHTVNYVYTGHPFSLIITFPFLSKSMITKKPTTPPLQPNISHGVITHHTSSQTPLALSGQWSLFWRSFC
ncbi:Hypothetical_protein [Hexamita inflata]|uniref:Hypothetical_protein n=1 Tax=Hexamita inflata TaxID=28002 RepID=A0AA86RHR0_9EUKA|nr:Hypothetical protein HINF_LOCUS65886 [Hexamita inflata]